MKTVYVAGPLTKGTPWLNVREACLVGAALMRAGLAVYVPHLSMLADMVDPLPYESWLAMDLEWVARCDAVVRIQGESVGADCECAHARNLALPVIEWLAPTHLASNMLYEAERVVRELGASARLHRLVATDQA